MSTPVSGFSKWSKTQKINWLAQNYFKDSKAGIAILEQYWNDDPKLQQLHDEFIENTLTNYYLPLGVAPNFLINNELYVIPMAIEESSVVAAASNAAKFWLDKGGFKAEILSSVKNGQVHLNYSGDASRLMQFFEQIKQTLLDDCQEITANMRKRGGGILNLELKDCTDQLTDYYQLHATFETLDAMGANFINSCLEQFAKSLLREADASTLITPEDGLEVVMSILSNYVPECVVRASVSCPVEALAQPDLNGEAFAGKMVRAVQIAETEVRRAVTHNKGIMNGVDAVILATGNDFRAVEAGVHAYAGRNGNYSSLTHAKVEDGVFHFWIELPLAVGTVGGLTKLHPLVKLCFEMLGNPNARQLMQIIAVAGLAQNFAALRSLVTTGIQKGHMKMHLMNILNQLDATAEEKSAAIEHFKTNTVSHAAAVNFLQSLRSGA